VDETRARRHCRPTDDAIYSTTLDDTWFHLNAGAERLRLLNGVTEIIEASRAPIVPDLSERHLRRRWWKKPDGESG
jgi:hypothetical protein